MSHIVELESQRNVCLMSMIAPGIYDSGIWRGLGHAWYAYKDISEHCLDQKQPRKNTSDV